MYNYIVYIPQSKLESKLSKLYKHLLLLAESLHQTKKSSNESVPIMLDSSEHIGQPIRDHFKTRLEGTTDILHECCHDLLSLSVLLPSAPWVGDIYTVIIIIIIHFIKYTWA